MTESDFLKTVMKYLRSGYELDPSNIESIENTIKQCYQRGFSVNDAFRYSSWTEEVNPDISEELALRKLKAISQKYPQKGIPYRSENESS